MTTATIEQVQVMGYKELQSLAKEFGIKANQKKAVLVGFICAAIEDMNEFEEPAPGQDAMDFIMNGRKEQSALPDTDDILADEDDEPTNERANVDTHEATNEQTNEGSNEPSASEASAPSEDEDDDSFFDDDEPVAVVTPQKTIEFVQSTHLAVHYRVKGEDVIVGWSTTDFRLHIWSNRKGSRLTSYRTLIKSFANLRNNVHGDIARVIAGFKRIAKKPAKIVLLERQMKQAANEVSRNTNTTADGENPRSQAVKENSRRTNRGCVDPQWLANFREEYELQTGELPNGFMIKAAWDNMQAETN